MRRSALCILLLLSLSVLPLQEVRAEQREYEIAFVKPIFTATAYQTNGFYKFFRIFHDISASTYVTHNLHLLEVPIVDDWGWSSGLNWFIHSPKIREFGISLGSNAIVINDIDVHNGILFKSDGRIRYKTVVVGFSEYVTAEQYSEYRRFVEEGGKLVLLDANYFLAEVAYNKDANTLRLVKGHGWSFDGKKANKDVFRRWPKQNAEWTGSNYFPLRRLDVDYNGAMANNSHPISVALRLRFGTYVFKDYVRHEENVVVNPRARIIALWSTHKEDGRVAAYELRHKKGIVFHTGIFGDNIITYDEAFQLMFVNMINYERPLKKLKVKVVHTSLGYDDYRAFLEVSNFSNEQLDVLGWKVVAGQRLLFTPKQGIVIPPRASKLIDMSEHVTPHDPILKDLLIFDSRWSMHHNLPFEEEQFKEPLRIYQQAF